MTKCLSIIGQMLYWIVFAFLYILNIIVRIICIATRWWICVGDSIWYKGKFIDRVYGDPEVFTALAKKYCHNPLDDKD